MVRSLKRKKIALWIAIIVILLSLTAVVVYMLFSRSQGGSLNGIEAEKARFEKVLQQAPDEELFIVFKYAIAHHYVPNRQVDPFYDMYVMVGGWQRSLMVYKELLDRENLLREIYPDLEVLDEYVHWGRQTGQPYPDTVVSQTILNNVRKDIKQLDSLMESPSYLESMRYKYFGTPLMHY